MVQPQNKNAKENTRTTPILPIKSIRSGKKYK